MSVGSTYEHGNPVVVLTSDPSFQTGHTRKYFETALRRLSRELFCAVAAVAGVALTLALPSAPSVAGDASEHGMLGAREIQILETRRTATPALVATLGVADARTAARAALALGRIGAPAGAPPLRERLTAHDPRLRAMSAYALGLLLDAPSLTAERRLARADANGAVRYAAVDAIGRIAFARPAAVDDAAFRDVAAAARGDADAIVRAHAAAALESFSAKPFARDVARELERDAGDRDAAVRWHAMWALYRGYARLASRDVLVRGLHHPDELYRVETLRAWGRRRDAPRAAIARLAADDPSWRVQYEARETLLRTGGKKPTEHLRAIPAGLHLPPLAAPGVADASRAAVRRPSRRLHAPAPERFPLAFVAPRSAAEMNGALPGPHPRVLVRTTLGDVVLRLYPEWAPGTVANFLMLARSGYFDGNRWFRVVPDFVDQTGDPHGDGNGDAGYATGAELNPVEQRSFVVAMGLDYANGRAKRDSAGTQFYITLSPQLHLDRDFSVFGEVERGVNVLAHLVESDRMLTVRPLATGASR